MVDVWDFSQLFAKWDALGKDRPKRPRDFPELTEQMNAEIAQMQSQAKLLSRPVSHGPAQPTLPPIVPKDDELTSEAPRAVSSRRLENDPKAPNVVIPARPKTARMAKPKEPMRLKPKHVPRVIPPIHTQVFRADPPELRIVNFVIHQQYVLRFRVQNVSSKTRSFKYVGPSDHAFTYRIIEQVENSLIRAGLHLTFELVFCATKQQDYQDQFEIIPGDEDITTTVPIVCFRDPPFLIFPEVVELGSVLAYSALSSTITITNTGGVASFSIPDPDSAQFSLEPHEFRLEKGESVELTVRFAPVEAGSFQTTFQILALFFSKSSRTLCVRGVGVIPDFKFSLCDDSVLVVPFLPSCADLIRKVNIINGAAVAIPFHLNILTNYIGNNSLRSIYPDLSMYGTDPLTCDGFEIGPRKGIFQANETIVFSIQWKPRIYAAYEISIIVVADDIPTADGITSINMLTIHLEATTGVPSITAFPPFIFYPSLVPRTKSIQSVDITNGATLPLKMQWRKSAVVAQSPIAVQLAPGGICKCALTCEVLKRKECPQRFGSRVFRCHKALMKQTMLAETWQIWSSDLGAAGACSATRDETLRVPTPCLASIGFGIRPDERLSSQLTRYADNVTTSSVRKGTALALTYAAQLAQPMLVADPPTLDFGSVLIATTTRRTLVLHNHFQCPICFSVDYPRTPEWVIQTNSNVVRKTESIEIELTFAEKIVIDAMITIIMYWCDDQGTIVPELPATTLQIPVCAIVDRPIIGISKRVLDLGIVFPTVTYNATTEIALLNAFPTDVQFICQSRDTIICMPRESESVSPVTPSDPPTIIDICRANESHEAVVKEYAQVTNEVSSLEPEQWTRIDITAAFSRLGQNMIPIICRTMGNWCRLAVIAEVNPPHVRLVTPTIDFSEDFVICNRSYGYCHAENECAVPSTIRVEMIDNCNGVFTLEDDGVFDLLPFSCVRIPVSCYSEIHGDYHGELNLRIRDPWQSDDIRIPLHVKARGSYFGFQKHTLGYQPGPDGDMISFGATIAIGSRPVLRRISLVNYSSEAITVDWSLSSFVKGRQSADLAIRISDDGNVNIEITELPDANLQFPFRMTTTRTQIASHGTTVVRVEFEPYELGEFGACIAARSGEFVHTLDLHATVVDEGSAHPKYIEESDGEDE